ncbi:MAG: hypothetical protein KC468_12355 [Myxococcales bacterium]|nr:hypothetical protein [Myxococcales bacterium]
MMQLGIAVDLQPDTPAKAPAAAAPAGDDGYAPAVGLTRADKEKAAMIEQQVSAKVASDYTHIVWAYGILWSLFVAYGVFLWFRSARLKADLAELRKALHDRDQGARA